MRIFLPIAALALLSIVILKLVTAPGAGTVVTLADYFAIGEDNVSSVLADRADSEGQITDALAEHAAQAVVRIRVQHGFRGEAHSTTHATGALVMGGKYVATVAHELEILQREPGARIEILLSDGRVLVGRARSTEHYSPGREQSDWALLDVVEPPDDLPSLELGRSSDGARLVLGFPGRHGRDRTGRVVLDDGGAAHPLRPLRILCATQAHTSAQLELTAGCVPIGGISGAPCLDAAGRLVAIQRAVSDTTRDGSTTSTLNVVGLDDLAAALARAEAAR